MRCPRRSSSASTADFPVPDRPVTRKTGNSATGRAKSITESADGLDRRGSVALTELLAQVPDVELHLVAGDRVRILPRELEQLLLAQHLVRVPDERLEQVVLRPG